MPSQLWGSMSNEEGVISLQEIILPSQEHVLERLETSINPLGPTANHGIDLFEEAIEIVSGKCKK